MLTSLSSCGKPGLESTCESGRCVFKYTDKVLCPKSLIETCELDGYKFDCIDVWSVRLCCCAGIGIFPCRHCSYIIFI